MTNVVLVATHDTGRYVGPYGRAIDTPALSGLADEGVCFRRAYCAAPTCSPSRGALFTGRSPHANGLIGLAHRGFSMDDHDEHLANYLSERGFESALAGLQHEAHFGWDEQGTAAAHLGYDRYLEGDPDAVRELPIDHDSTRSDLATARAAAEYVREADDEFFLSVGLQNTHKPFPLEQDLVDPDRVRVPDPLPDAPAIREEMAGYRVLAEYVDECVGIVLDALRESGRLEDTLFVFTTDHGIPFPEMKCNLNESGLGISLLARFPDGAGVPRGVAEDALVSNVDLFPTICDLLDLEVPDRVAGRSLLPLVRGEVDAVREAVFGEVTYHAAYEPKRCVTTERYRYVRRFDEAYRERVAPNVDAGPAKAFLHERGYFDREPPREALYDLHLDPGEGENLIHDPAYADVRESLVGRLEEWMERTDDPLLDGPVSKPEGAVADPQDGHHPGEGAYEPADAR